MPFVQFQEPSDPLVTVHITCLQIMVPHIFGALQEYCEPENWTNITEGPSEEEWAEAWSFVVDLATVEPL